MANHDAYLQSTSGDAYNQSGAGDNPGIMLLGNNAGFSNDAAVRFPNVTIPQGTTVNDAQLRLKAGGEGSGNIVFDTYGIKEANTASFSSNPFGRTRTSAKTTQTSGMPGVGAFIGVNVTSQVNEMLGQGSWASGNAMGFLCFNNNASSGASAWIEDDFRKCQLLIQLVAPGNFTPTPSSIGSPTFPTATDWGIKVSAPGVDVKTATESQLYFTSRKKELRVSQETAIDSSTTQFAHGLAYSPSVLGYYTDGSGHNHIMNSPASVFSVSEYIASDGTNVYYFVSSGETGYLYTFIDPLT